MEIHVPERAPAHVHGCPIHPLGGDGGIGYNEEWAIVDGEGVLVKRTPVRRSDACYWESEHDVVFKTQWSGSYALAVANGVAKI